jgi:YD repeat-containing protein
VLVNTVNCPGCGAEVEPTDGGICHHCGWNQESSYQRRKVQLHNAVKLIILLATAVEIAFYISRTTERAAVAHEALARMNSNPSLTKFLGSPIKSESVSGNVQQDETGWKEAKLTLQIRGPRGRGTAHVIGGRGSGPWVFTTLEVTLDQHTKLDLISGSIVEDDPAGYVDVHTQTPAVPEYSNPSVAPPRWDGNVPCVFATIHEGAVNPQIGDCPIPTEHLGGVDRFEVDLRYGAFILRQTDLYLNDVFEVPLTRTYASDDWISKNNLHAFGWNTNHPYDIAPLGSRNPYTFQLIALEDSNFVYFDRISKGTGYADSVFQHSETSTKYYKAITRWNGNGWTTKLADGSEIRFPESYNAKNLAQGGPTEMRDAKGNVLQLQRGPQRDLVEILTPHGHWIKFQHDDRARILRADDDAGNWTKYEYNSDGMLSDVTSSSGRQRHYAYNKTWMTRVADEKGNVLVRNFYDAGMIVREEFAGGSVFSYRYRYADKARYPYAVEVAFMRTTPFPNRNLTAVRVANAIPEYVRNNFHQ